MRPDYIDRVIGLERRVRKLEITPRGAGGGGIAMTWQPIDLATGVTSPPSAPAEVAVAHEIAYLSGSLQFDDAGELGTLPAAAVPVNDRTMVVHTYSEASESTSLLSFLSTGEMVLLDLWGATDYTGHALHLDGIVYRQTGEEGGTAG